MEPTATKVEEFQEQQPRLFWIAYRMLGSASEAEDIVQDTFVDHRRASTEDLRSPPSYLTTGVINLRQDGFTGMERGACEIGHQLTIG